MDQQESISIILAARTAIYRLLHAVFGGDPSAEMIRALHDGTLGQLASVLCEEGDALSCATAELANAAQQVADGGDAALGGSDDALDGSDAALDELSAVYCRLFVGPGKVEADPWESVYNEGEAMLFQKSTLDVRRAYVAQGLIPQSYPHVADDHIGLELDFMGMLAERMENTQLDKAGRSEFTNYLQASQEFLSAHLLPWVPKFRARIEQARKSGIYHEAAAVLDEFLRTDAEILAELANVVQ